MSYQNEAARLRKLARNPNILFWWTDHAEKERQNDSIAKIDVHNMLK
jgi:hypothetical protein